MERIVKPERDKENKVIVMSTPNAKRVVLTGAVTAITIAGTLYGAGIKTNQEVAQVCGYLHCEIDNNKQFCTQLCAIQILIGLFCYIERPENPRNNH